VQQASAAGQARNRCLTPAGAFEFGKLAIRRVGESEPPAATDHRGSSRMVRGARLGSRYRRAVLRRAEVGASQAVDNPGLKERAPCRSLAADRFEASHCPAPVACGRQLRPRSHDHGHAVHPFIALPHTTGPRCAEIHRHGRRSASTSTAGSRPHENRHDHLHRRSDAPTRDGSICR
jgi:hypothetical protein